MAKELTLAELQAKIEAMEKSNAEFQAKQDEKFNQLAADVLKSVKAATAELQKAVKESGSIDVSELQKQVDGMAKKLARVN